ncbi:cytochrome c [Melaminivora jejuensis]|uniref:c-type cytochrome n=1 Tax=Melaminivora jejuensis TaxID=1267217 RepID=UPI001ADEF387|nr:cytochrome c [Melaminivora jejuensis]UHJ65198.1 cytochrome c [Melaminivora jejuensis]
MKFKTFALALATAASTTLALPAAAQFAKPEDAIKYRQSTLFVIGQHFSRIGAMVNGKAPFDAKAAQADAEVIASLAALPWTGFGPGTDKAAPNKSKPEVWSDSAKFTEHAQKFEAEAPKLLAAAKSGNLDQIKAAFGPTANSCKSCHDNFRAR